MKNFIILTPVYNDWENLNKLLEKRLTLKQKEIILSLNICN